MQQSQVTTSHPTTRKRQALSLQTKLDIIKATEDDPKITHADIAQLFGCPRSTITTILSKKDQIIKESLDATDLSTKKRRASEWPELEKSLFEWVKDANSHNIHLTEEAIRTKAKSLFPVVYANDPSRSKFNGSDGWLAGFKNRHGLRGNVHRGESASADPEQTPRSQEVLRTLLSQYSLHDIFNADEIGLFYRMLPNKTLATSAKSRLKKNKDRITVLLATNASGTEKLKPFIIGTAKTPACYGRNFDMRTLTSVRYRNNDSAWMTEGLFQDWLRWLNGYFEAKRRKIVLLVDNAACHRWGRSLTFDYVRVHFLPPNMTTHTQPLDAGIIANFKLKYRAQHLAQIIYQFDNGEKQSKLTMRQAIDFIVNAWEGIEEKTISNCWKATGILPCGETSTILKDLEDGIKLLQNTVQDLIKGITTITTPMDAESYLNIEKDLGYQTERPRTDEEIVKNALQGIEQMEQDDETESDEETEDERVIDPINSVQALEYLDKLSFYFQTTSIIKEDESRYHLKELRKATENIQNAIVASKKQAHTTNHC